MNEKQYKTILVQKESFHIGLNPILIRSYLDWVQIFSFDPLDRIFRTEFNRIRILQYPILVQSIDIPNDTGSSYLSSQNNTLFSGLCYLWSATSLWERVWDKLV